LELIALAGEREDLLLDFDLAGDTARFDRNGLACHQNCSSVTPK
jgi:hypothetical protein